ncbi:FAD dependent oxidoreductase [Coniophora puteana RWD-64-598 SS2]|uniref:FAD dependent oxidoreductase n=1 Tax=Coniophora puteana (strain RWD-64-598) TaxID=741705 RepID=A0A5M3MVY2_CONPW|nr:FAD dependent oxidoreductase [Coniophora puteana RWD-64-598 SS2]EIW83210.1 FAD dependent oxidoreductase [Coniophora puteana RWD-64-598 SS2]
MAAPDQRNIVIIGGGIIGCTTAYYLSRHPSVASTITVLEASAHGVAQGASGKAGGLVAKWAYPKELVAVSFPEHVRLAEEHDGAARWGWRFVGCGSWEGDGVPAREEDKESGTGVGGGGRRKSLEKKLGLEPEHEVNGGGDTTGLPQDLDWVAREQTTAYAPMAPAGHTAQVHPYLFTTSMMDLATANGAALVQGRATQIVISNDGRVSGVVYQTSDSEQPHTLPATHVVLAAGAWSPTIAPLAALPISATRAHSITIRPRPPASIAPYVLFTEIRLPAAQSRRTVTVSPEIYARPDNEVYACGPGDDSVLPGSVDDVEVDQAACESIREHVASISRELREGVVERRQACFLPSIPGGPVVGAADKIAKGMYIATGHTCWGICNAPGTAKALAELILEGKIKSGNLKKLSPSNFL